MAAVPGSQIKGTDYMFPIFHSRPNITNCQSNRKRLICQLPRFMYHERHLTSVAVKDGLNKLWVKRILWNEFVSESARRNLTPLNQVKICLLGNVLIIKLEAFKYDKNQFGLVSSNDKTSSDAAGMLFVEFMHQWKQGKVKQKKRSTGSSDGANSRYDMFGISQDDMLRQHFIGLADKTINTVIHRRIIFLWLLLYCGICNSISRLKQWKPQTQTKLLLAYRSLFVKIEISEATAMWLKQMYSSEIKCFGAAAAD
ncbi:hypothetical protein OPV22_026874 [Ensete ventricosum]|uniref:Uncharacterized protein n=1 Tax=Ensete ventricosum TaxID=4639 RepID=A0AAV8P4T8_ENSVE|nr:hypothetical protein OPV22_026874 [Ensete ventricosum]